MKRIKKADKNIVNYCFIFLILCSIFNMSTSQNTAGLFFEDEFTIGGSVTDGTKWTGENNSTRYVTMKDIVDNQFGPNKAMTWTNKGTYGFVYVKSGFRTHSVDNTVWIWFDFLDLEYDKTNFTLGVTTGYNETWRKYIKRADVG
jgi:hypothetical protein